MVLDGVRGGLTDRVALDSLNLLSMGNLAASLTGKVLVDKADAA